MLNIGYNNNDNNNDIDIGYTATTWLERICWFQLFVANAQVVQTSLACNKSTAFGMGGYWNDLHM